VGTIDSHSLALLIAEAAYEKKAEDAVVMDVRGVSDITDFFIICSGNSTRMVKTIADNVIEKLEASGNKVEHIEGKREGLWILLDYGVVVAHIFYKSIREFYNLERLWADASRVFS
jgi:ribosome-associated protein